MTHDATESRPDAPAPALRLGVAVLVLVAAVQAASTLGTLGTPQVYRKDLLQDYLAARAILDGKDPYQPMSALRAEYLGAVDGALAFPHPTPHPPPALLLTLPLGLTTYPRAAAAWLVLEYLLLGVSCVLIVRHVRETGKATAPLALAALALWTVPVRDDLVLGQFSLVILALLVGSYLALRGRRAVLGGALLGAAVSLKFLGWPLVLFYAWKRQWRVVFAASAALVLMHIAAACVSPRALATYYASVAPHANADYSASDLNISVWAIGQRFFGGLYSQATVNTVTAPPFVDRPAFAQRASAVLALATFLIFLRVASTRRDETDGFLVLLCASTVLNPIAWEIYLSLLLLPLAVVGFRLAERSWPPRPTLALAGLVLFVIVLKAPRELVLGEGPERPVSAVRALVSAVPLFCPIAAAWLIVASAAPNPGRSSGTQGRQSSQAEPPTCTRGESERLCAGRAPETRPVF